jgi:branched-chain amino acid transport system substrate-binding protein
MQRMILVLAGIVAMPLTPIAKSQEPAVVPVVNILELSGAGASVGTNMEMGIELAVSEINSKGGILGRKIAATTFDSQTNVTIARSLAQRAVDMNAYAVIGPVFSGSVLASMVVTRAAEIPNFTGAAASSITQMGNPYVFRTSLSQEASMPRIAAYMRDVMKAHSIAIVWANNDFGKGGRDTLVRQAHLRGMKIVADIPCELGQVNFASETTTLKGAGADVLFPYLNEEESARLLRQLRAQGYAGRIVGESTSVSQKVIELAGEAANGVIGHVALTADAPEAPMRSFVAKFETRFHVKPDHNAIAGYMTPYIIKTVTERVGKFDTHAFVQAMKGASLSAKDEPGLLVDLKYDSKGEPDHHSWIIEVQNGHQVVIAKMPAVRGNR